MARKRREVVSENVKYYQRKFLINKIRQVSRWWPYKNIVKKAAQVKVEVGIHKNGKTKYKTKYKCNCCNQLFDNVEMDHIIPVVNTEEGFVDWNTYINGMLCDINNYQALCENCHSDKTSKENKKRKKKRKKT